MFAWVVPVVGIGMLIASGTQAEARGNPLYWLVMIPLALCAGKLTRYEPGPIRWLRPAQAGAPLVAAATALVATATGEEPTPYWVATAICAALAGVAWLCWPGSMLAKEGPAR